MRRRNNNKFCITMILGVIAIFLANCHNVNAAEFTAFNNRKPALTLSSLVNSCKNCVVHSCNAAKPALAMPTIKINQAADLGLNLRTHCVAAK